MCQNKEEKLGDELYQAVLKLEEIVEFPNLKFKNYGENRRISVGYIEFDKVYSFEGRHIFDKNEIYSLPISTKNFYCIVEKGNGDLFKDAIIYNFTCVNSDINSFSKVSSLEKLAKTMNVSDMVISFNGIDFQYINILKNDNK